MFLRDRCRFHHFTDKETKDQRSEENGLLSQSKGVGVGFSLGEPLASVLNHHPIKLIALRYSSKDCDNSLAFLWMSSRSPNAVAFVDLGPLNLDFFFPCHIENHKMSVSSE
jgi:hypothetical protein